MTSPAVDEPRSVVVTGGATGIGRSVVRRLVRHGYHVVVIDVASPAAPGTGGGLDWVHGSAAEHETAQQAAALARSRAPLVGWVNNAAVFRDAQLLQVTTAAFMEQVAANLVPVVEGTRCAVAAFLDAGTSGAVVNLSSHQARRAVPGAAAYVTAKAAIEGLTRAAAVDYGRYGVRVNAVAPGSVRTERFETHLATQPREEAEAFERDAAALHPLGRIAEADEVAAAVEFLLSPAASFISGAVLPVDGGRTILAADPEAR